MKTLVLMLTHSTRSAITRPITTLVAAMAVAWLPPVSAGTLTWTLEGVTFDDGNVVTGSFVTDDATGAVLDWDIRTNASFISHVHYTPAFTGAEGLSPNGFSLLAVPIHQVLHLAFTSSLTTAGVAMLDTSGDPGGSFEVQYFNNVPYVHNITAGFAVSVPEPGVHAMFLLGLGLVGFWIRHRRPVSLPPL